MTPRNELEKLREAGKIVEMIEKLRRTEQVLEIHLRPGWYEVLNAHRVRVSVRPYLKMSSDFYAPTLGEALAAAVQSLESEVER